MSPGAVPGMGDRGGNRNMTQGHPKANWGGGGVNRGGGGVNRGGGGMRGGGRRR
jgi:hypothetical protein